MKQLFVRCTCYILLLTRAVLASPAGAEGATAALSVHNPYDAGPAVGGGAVREINLAELGVTALGSFPFTQNPTGISKEDVLRVLSNIQRVGEAGYPLMLIVGRGNKQALPSRAFHAYVPVYNDIDETAFDLSRPDLVIPWDLSHFAGFMRFQKVTSQRFNLIVYDWSVRKFISGMGGLYLLFSLAPGGNLFLDLNLSHMIEAQIDYGILNTFEGRHPIIGRHTGTFGDIVFLVKVAPAGERLVEKKAFGSQNFRRAQRLIETEGYVLVGHVNHGGALTFDKIALERASEDGDSDLSDEVLQWMRSEYPRALLQEYMQYFTTHDGIVTEPHPLKHGGEPGQYVMMRGFKGRPDDTE